MATKAPDTPENTPTGVGDDQQTLEAAIRLRAYEISQSPDSGTPEENWERAEREIGPVTADR